MSSTPGAVAGYPSVTVPATEIIHDRMNPLLHPLCGIPPLYACAMTITQGQRIQAQSAAYLEDFKDLG